MLLFGFALGVEHSLVVPSADKDRSSCLSLSHFPRMHPSTHLSVPLSDKERKKLALTLKDTKSVVAKLELVCGVVIHALFVLSYLWIFNVRACRGSD